MNFYEYGLVKIAEDLSQTVYPKKGPHQSMMSAASRIGNTVFKKLPFLDTAITTVGTIGAYKAAKTQYEGIRDAVEYVVDKTPDFHKRRLNYPCADDISGPSAFQK